MSIRYIIGGTGSGKSHFIYKKILEQAGLHKKKSFFVIVPEQSNLQVQRELVKMSRSGCIMNVDVLSFMRLAHRVFDEVGRKERLILEDVGKSMVVRKLLNHLSSEFQYFKKAAGKVGFTEEMKSILTELMQYSIGVNELRRLEEEGDFSPVIKAKLHDTRLIYEAFNEYKKEKYIVAEKLLEELSEVLRESRFLDGAVFVFDGFTGFTPTQLKVIKALMPKAEELNFVFTMDRESYEKPKVEAYELFHLSKSMIIKLNEIAIKRGERPGEAIFISPYEERGAITAIEEGIFRLKKARKFRDEADVVQVRACRNPKEEVAEILTEILFLVREKGYRYKDIAIIAGDIEEYGELIYHGLKGAGIPCFLDSKKSIMDNPLIEFIRASLMVIEEDFSYEAVTRYLKSGFSGIWKSRIDIFENYILARGMKGKRRYGKPFLKEGEEFKNEREKKEGEIVEGVRAVLFSRFSPLIQGFKDKKKGTKDRTLLLYEFISLHKIEEKLFLFSKKFEREEKPLLSGEYAKCYEIVMGTFEKLVELLGEEVFNIEDYTKILEAGFLEGRAGFIPPGLDRIVIGDLKRTRLKDVKALFLLGVNEGKIPQTVSKKGLLTDREREKISTIVELSPTAKEKMFRELFYIYMMLSTPRERLYLTYSGSGSDGKAIRPSYIVDKVLSLFEGKERKIRREGEEDFLLSLRKDGGLSYLRKALREERAFEPEVLSLVRYHKEREKGRKYLSLMEGYQAKPICGKLDRELAKKLYGEMKGSITRLETFRECPFSHFLSYGLRLRERKSYELNSMDIGTIFHDVLERFSDKVLRTKEGFFRLSEEERKRILEESLAEVTNYGYDILLSNSRNQYRLERIKKLSDRTTWAVVNQIRAGEFQPFLFEEEFVVEKMRGRIDRVDTVLSDYLPDGSLLSGEDFSKVEYARIIDYKSGKKKFDLNLAYYGLDLQLITYMRQIIGILEHKAGHEKNLVIPAGAFYYNIENPTRKKGEGEEAFLKELQLEGFILGEPHSLQLMDACLAKKGEEGFEFSPSAKSNVIKVGTKKDGSLTKGSAIYTLEDIKELTEYSETEVREIRGEIAEGKIAPHPYQLGEAEGCKYCVYDSICRFKSGIEGYRFNKLQELEEEDIFEKIRKKNGKKVDEGAE